MVIIEASRESGVTYQVFLNQKATRKSETSEDSDRTLEEEEIGISRERGQDGERDAKEEESSE